jgi:hypothetical protein
VSNDDLKKLDDLIDYLAHSMRLDLPDATFLRRAYADQRSELARLRKVEAAAREFEAVMNAEVNASHPSERNIAAASIKLCEALAGEGGTK